VLKAIFLKSFYKTLKSKALKQAFAIDTFLNKGDMFYLKEKFTKNYKRMKRFFL